MREAVEDLEPPNTPHPVLPLAEKIRHCLRHQRAQASARHARAFTQQPEQRARDAHGDRVLDRGGLRKGCFLGRCTHIAPGLDR